ncbi:MAG: hypothetical protein A2Z12_10205 [Actinobacteria bacterium RBG_16_68_21]|nr:MAG: hypothetical protein A2Z12_10205 [Actinobacteria bacterium RBG_16_68_21]
MVELVMSIVDELVTAVVVAAASPSSSPHAVAAIARTISATTTLFSVPGLIQSPPVRTVEYATRLGE